MAVKKLRSELMEDEHARLKAMEDALLSEASMKHQAEAEARYALATMLKQ
jgi:hypothetical protein